MKARALLFTSIPILVFSGCEQHPRIHPDARLFEKSLVALVEKNRRYVVPDGTLYSDEKFFLLMQSDCETEAKTLPAAPAAMMEAMKEFYHSGAVVLHEVNSATTDFEEAGGLNFAVIFALPDQESLGAHRDRLQRLAHVLNSLAAIESGSEKKFREFLTAAGVEGQALEDAPHVFLRHTTATSRAVHREADENFMKAGIEALQLLHDNPGAWEVTDQPTILFHNIELEQKWNDIMHQLVEAKTRSESA